MGSIDFFAKHPVFTLEEYAGSRREDGSAHPRTVGNLLAAHVKAGRVVRVRRGLYASMPPGTGADAPAVDPYLVAGHLAPDAIVAYHAALQFRGRAYSVWKRFEYTAGVPRRPFAFQGMEFVAVQAPPEVRDRFDLGGGWTLERHVGGEVRVATFERTLVDVMDSPAHGGGWEEIWRSLEMIEFLDLDEVIRLALDRTSSLTAARVGLYLDRHREELMVEERHLAPLRSRRPPRPRYLDRRREPGRLVKEWNLIVPERVLSREWEETL